ncbi:MAG TPA: nitrile hydratase accessory protein [Gemmataceae bacterium]|nr:nitrile hydratase accessory protein [Gemmataceae bacterium]
MSNSPVAIEDYPAMPRDAEGPVFNEPWQARAFALAVRLSEAGWFSTREWTAFLSQEIHSASAPCSRDLHSQYYHHWLSALERLCIEKRLVTAADMRRRKEEWRQAYLHTPHGQPIELSAGASDSLV